MDKYEMFAVSQYLSDWPEDISFTELMDIMHLEDDTSDYDITIWQPIEHLPMAEVARLINVTLESMKERFK